MRPLIYIASLRRTGSTLLSEALTQPPHAFIFVEPQLGENIFGLAAADERALREEGIDLEPLVRRLRLPSAIRRRLHVDRDYVMRRFKKEVLPRLASRFDQVGVKEIRNAGWRCYRRHFPDMRVILTSRDPRDVYISLHHRVRKGRGSWRGPLSPERVAEDLNREFRHQLAMHEALECLKVRYEDLCRDPGVLRTIKEFADCGIPNVGQVGRFLKDDEGRVGEHQLHEGRVTDRRVNRWAQEEDPQLRERSERTFDLMPEYRRFWGYERLL